MFTNEKEAVKKQVSGFHECVDRVNGVNRINVNKTLIRECLVEWRRGKKKIRS